MHEFSKLENKGKAMRMNGVSFGLQTPPSSRLFQLAADHPSSQAFPLPLSPIPLLRFPSNSNWPGREEGGRTQKGAGSETKAGSLLGRTNLVYPYL